MIYMFLEESNSKELSSQNAINIMHVLSMSIKKDVREKGVLWITQNWLNFKRVKTWKKEPVTPC